MKILVIGGGLSGLATGALLAKNGHQVTIIEKNKELGGRARILKAKGFTFDMGPSWYMMPEVIENLFNELGTSTSKYFHLKELEKKYRIFSEEFGKVDLVSNLEKNFETFEKIAPQSSKKIKKLFLKTNNAYEIAVNKFLHKPYLEIKDFINFPAVYYGLKLLSQYNPFQSYHSFIKKYVSHPFLQKIFEFHTVFLGGDPYSTPALYSILISADFNQKIWYPMGGVGKLVEALEKICLENNVEIISQASVEKIIVDHKINKLTGVNYIKNNKNIFDKADVVVSTADYPFTELNLLPKESRQYSEDFWQKKDFSISSVLIYLGINKKLKNVEHHNFYFQENWDNHFNTIKKTIDLPENPNFYLCASSVTDESVAPKNHENLFVLVPVSIKTTTENIDKYIDSVLNHIEEKIGEKFQDHIIYKKTYYQTDFEKDYNAYKGNALGLNHTLTQSVFLRPNMKSAKVKGLYYAGQFTQPGVGVPMVLRSAQYINKLIEKDYQDEH